MLHVFDYLVSELVKLGEEPWLKLQVFKFRAHAEDQIRSTHTAQLHDYAGRVDLAGQSKQPATRHLQGHPRDFNCG